ncbi:MAG: CARDB domain-containing protein, partial [bacterium]
GMSGTGMQVSATSTVTITAAQKLYAKWVVVLADTLQLRVATYSVNENDGAMTVTTPVSASADFVIASIVIAPVLPTVDESFTTTVTVRNQGTKSGNAGYLYVWLDKPGTVAVDEKCDTSVSVGTLKPGQATAVKLTLTAPKTRGTFTMRAFIDAKNEVTEDDEYNNQATLVYYTGLPDFKIGVVRLSPAIPVADKTFTAYVTVTNSGEVAGDAGYLDVWADGSVLAAIPVPGLKTTGDKYKTVGILQPGATKTITVTGLKAPAAHPAPVLGLLIDSRAKTWELDEDNNWFEFDYECQ